MIVRGFAFVPDSEGSRTLLSMSVGRYERYNRYVPAGIGSLDGRYRSNGSAKSARR